MGKVQENQFFISGRVVMVGGKKEYSINFKKRELVIKVKVGRYEKPTPIEFINERMDLLENIRKGDWVNIDFRLSGHEFKNDNGTFKYISSIEGLSCVKED